MGFWFKGLRGKENSLVIIQKTLISIAATIIFDLPFLTYDIDDQAFFIERGIVFAVEYQI